MAKSVSSLNNIAYIVSDIVAEIIKPEFVICAVSDIGGVLLFLNTVFVNS